MPFKHVTGTDIEALFSRMDAGHHADLPELDISFIALDLARDIPREAPVVRVPTFQRSITCADMLPPLPRPTTQLSRAMSLSMPVLNAPPTPPRHQTAEAAASTDTRVQSSNTSLPPISGFRAQMSPILSARERHEGEPEQASSGASSASQQSPAVSRKAVHATRQVPQAFLRTSTIGADDILPQQPASKARSSAQSVRTAGSRVSGQSAVQNSYRARRDLITQSLLLLDLPQRPHAASKRRQSLRSALAAHVPPPEPCVLPPLHNRHAESEDT
jgi:hypothetical protein